MSWTWPSVSLWAGRSARSSIRWWLTSLCRRSGSLLGGLNFKDLFVNLKEGTAFASLDAAQKAGVPVIAWGNWVTTVINFLIVAWVMFLLVKGMNAAKKEEPAPAPAPPPANEVLLAEIRDLLKSR